MVCSKYHNLLIIVALQDRFASRFRMVHRADPAVGAPEHKHRDRSGFDPVPLLVPEHELDDAGRLGIWQGAVRTAMAVKPGPLASMRKA
jgi:hypothetical protein